MKTIRITTCLFFFLALAGFSFAQQAKTETIPVSGNCGMCKGKIEKAAKKAGATAATWNVDSKILTVAYPASATNALKIQRAIAAVGYDTRDVKASNAAYNKLDGCCHYDRSSMKPATAAHCGATCERKDGKCADMANCKEKGCCKDEAVCKTGSCCDETSAH